MPAFDHVPVVTLTEYGPSIHNDPVAMDNETLRTSGITDLRHSDDGLQIRVSILGDLLDLLRTVAAEVAGPNGNDVIERLKDLDWAASATRSDDALYPDEMSRIEDDVLEVLGITDTTTTVLLRGVAPLVLRDRITDETPMEVFRAHKAILDARAGVLDPA